MKMEGDILTLTRIELRHVIPGGLHAPPMMAVTSFYHTPVKMKAKVLDSD